MSAISLTPKLPWQLLVDEINSLNKDTGAKFTLTDLTWVIKSTDNAAGTGVLTLSPGVGTAYFNTREITYHRLDLAKWFRNVAIRVYVDDVTTIGAVVDLLAERYGMQDADGKPFLDKTTDIDASTLATVVGFDESGIQDVKLVAAAGSLAWYGEVMVKVYNRKLDLSNIITTPDLGTLKYVDEGDGTKTSVRMVTYPVDLSAFAPALGALVVDGTLDADTADEVVAAIKAATEISDSLSTELATALKAGKVSYNGTSAASTDTGVNAAYTNVVIIPITATANLYGSAVLGFDVA